MWVREDALVDDLDISRSYKCLGGSTPGLVL
jgi:hypothetical protein